MNAYFELFLWMYGIQQKIMVNRGTKFCILLYALIKAIFCLFVCFFLLLTHN